VREPVSVETLRRELLLLSGPVVSTLLAHRIAEDARRPACGLTPPLETPAIPPADAAPVEGLSHSALPPEVGLILSSPCLTTPCGPVADPASGREQRDRRTSFRQQRERRLKALRGDCFTTPDEPCGDHLTPAFAAVARFSGTSVGQPPCRGDANLPTGSHARIAARKAGYAQRNVDERPPAGGEPHRHR
jgi:hypothetical protein